MQFIIIHGSYGTPESNWFLDLKEKLKGDGQHVIVPQFPIDNWEEVTNNGPDNIPTHQNLANWLQVFKETVVPQLDPQDKICVVAHSIGAIFILHAVLNFDLKIDSAIFVAPFFEKLAGDWQINLVNRSFYKTDFNFQDLKQRIPLSYVLYSDTDPYVGKKYSLDFAEKMSSSIISVTKAGHMNSEVGFTKFPLVFELCKSRLEPSAYQ